MSHLHPTLISGALARSVWNKTVQEFLAPNIVLFYHSDWTLYLNDRSPNHKDSAVIMRELGDASGINSRALVAFRPGMRGAREKLQWVSTRITTLQEDVAYSLFGMFGIHLPVIYGENKQNALGRLLQDIVAKSGDCQQASLHVELLHPHCHLCYLKTRCRHQSPRCGMPLMQNWIRGYIKYANP